MSMYEHVCVSVLVRLRLWSGRRDYGRYGGANGDDPRGQQDDDEDDDEDHHHDDHDQLDVLPPVGARHFLGCLLEVLGLGEREREREKRDHSITKASPGMGR